MPLRDASEIDGNSMKTAGRRQMAPRQAKRIIVMIGVNSTYGRGAVEGILEYANQRCNWDIVLETVTDAPSVLARVLAAIKYWKPHGIIAQFHDRDLITAVRERGISAVDITAGGQAGFPTVRCDYIAAGRVAVRHLMEIGFRKFAFHGYVERAEHGRSHAGWREREYLVGFEDELRRQNFACEVISFRDSDICDGNRRDALRAQLSPPVGVLSESAALAREMIWACRDMGLSVPRDVAVLSGENDDLACTACKPTISGVMVPVRRIGQRAAEMLGAMIRAGKAPKGRFIKLPPLDVWVRQSTDVLAVTDPLVSSAVQYVREHSAQDITATDVARHVSLSQRALEYRFATSLGRAPVAELRRVRVEKAKILLAETDLKLSIVAAKVGVRQYRTFQRIFRQHAGVTPYQYRLQLRK
jgi:LacI family transcriptional regulator